MKTQSAKAKGRRLQQWLREKLIDYFKLGETDVVSRSMGAGGTDLILSPEALASFPYAVECKNQEKVAIWAAWEQASANVEGQQYPLLLISKNHKAPLIVVDAERFIALHNKPKRSVRGF